MMPRGGRLFVSLPKLFRARFRAARTAPKSHSSNQMESLLKTWWLLVESMKWRASGKSGAKYRCSKNSRRNNQSSGDGKAEARKGRPENFSPIRRASGEG